MQSIFFEYFKQCAKCLVRILNKQLKHHFLEEDSFIQSEKRFKSVVKTFSHPTFHFFHTLAHSRINDMATLSYRSAYQVRRAGQGVGLSASGLSVAKTSGRKSVHGHLYQPLDARVLQEILLTRLRLEHHVEGERLQLQFVLMVFLLIHLKKLFYFPPLKICESFFLPKFHHRPEIE